MKKMTYFVMALALVLGLSQCKKEQMPTDNQTEGVFITLDVNGGNNGNSKVIVNPMGHTDPDYATVTFETGDTIYVANDGKYRGFLIYNGSKFVGTIFGTNFNNEDYLHFYFLGGLGFKPTIDETNNTATVSISNQTTKYPVISYAHSKDLFDSDVHSYTAKLQNYCSIVKFTTNSIPTATAVTVKGMKNTVAVNFGANNAATSTSGSPYTFTKSGTGDITLHAVSPTERWAILLEQDAVNGATVTASGYSNSTCNVPGIANNTYHPNGVQVSLTPAVWDGDLSKLTNESTEAFATAADGMTITGTLGVDKKVSIAAGATVTLDGVTINGTNSESYQWAGLTCLGNANIILSDENTVKGFYEIYPGIYVPSGNTLTISGSGSLNVSSNGEGAGIGSVNFSSCGNISITGGTIEATGGNNSAGIGSGFNGSCGNISITGGTIEATGGTYAAGIGCGYSGSCGSITITDGVTSVTAKRGAEIDWMNCKCIGLGASFGYGTCGTVTIGGFGYGTTGADPNQNDNMTFIYPAPAGPSLTWTMSSSFSCSTNTPYTEGGITATLVAGQGGEATWQIDEYYYGSILLQSGNTNSSLTFACSPSSSVKIKKIVVLCMGANSGNGWPEGWNTEEGSYPNPTKLMWNGTPTKTVTLSTTNIGFVSIYGITKIEFYLEE